MANVASVCNDHIGDKRLMQTTRWLLRASLNKLWPLPSTAGELAIQSNFKAGSYHLSDADKSCVHFCMSILQYLVAAGMQASVQANQEFQQQLLGEAPHPVLYNQKLQKQFERCTTSSLHQLMLLGGAEIL